MSAALAALGLLFTAIFLLTLLQRVFSGPLNEEMGRLPDLTVAERWTVRQSCLDVCDRPLSPMRDGRDQST